MSSDKTRRFSLAAACRITRAQAAVRPMEADDLARMIRRLFTEISSLSMEGEERPGLGPDSIREDDIVCLENNQPYKMLTKSVLARFGLTPEGYREKWGIPAKTPLMARALVRRRQETMRGLQARGVCKGKN